MSRISILATAVAIVCGIALVCGIAPATSRAAEEWGDLALRLVYDGEPPMPRELKIDRDKAVCKELFDESLLVSAENKGIANVLVWIFRAEGEAAFPVHPDYEKNIKAEVPLTIKGCRYEPHVTLVRAPQVLVIHNQDPIGHNVKTDLLANTSFNVIFRGDAIQHFAFDAAEKLPARLADSIHPWMNGWLLVRDDRYMAASDASGKLVLKNLPAGRWTFRLWHERAGFLRSFTRDGKQVDWPQEGLALDIKAGTNDLGDVLVKPAVFEK
jgi:hypothetical protein